MTKKKPSDLTFAYLILIIIILTVVCILASLCLLVVKIVNRDPTEPNEPTGLQTEEVTDEPVSLPGYDPILEESADAGMAYIDRMIFFGESTTTHLRSRGVLSGGTETHQVWADSSGTKTLSSKLLSETLVYPPTGENLTLAAALEKEQPAYLVLSFGLNNIAHFVNNKQNYVNNYNKLIDAVQKASPNTRIILQSVYPVSAACDDFSVDGATVCSYTETLNGWLREIASTHENVKFADTASMLKAADGTLLPAYDSGDGVHLTAQAYQQILHYLRTHAWQD
ncbi:MAG: hypothetical protein IJX19_11805 [Clostridia bacterium]|nr:hypothetical protein [Clostridia bacterium]